MYQAIRIIYEYRGHRGIVHDTFGYPECNTPDDDPLNLDAPEERWRHWYEAGDMACDGNRSILIGLPGSGHRYYRCGNEIHFLHITAQGPWRATREEAQADYDHDAGRAALNLPILQAVRASLDAWYTQHGSYAEVLTACPRHAKDVRDAQEGIYYTYVVHTGNTATGIRYVLEGEACTFCIGERLRARNSPPGV